MFVCGNCEKKGCTKGDLDHLLEVCPTRDEEIKDKAKKLYSDEENHKIAFNAAVIEAEGYCKNTRLEETIDFMKKCGYQKIGLAFCMGLKSEAKTLIRILTAHGFEVSSVICKNGAISKRFLGLSDAETVSGSNEEIMCNPIGQALTLNKEKVQFTILFGLCVGHDTLVLKYLEAPATVLVVKDRVLCHNPIAAIYQADAYYKKKLGL
ncbi:MAG: DUF1847 domain-containing protein [Clostridium sp.]